MEQINAILKECKEDYKVSSIFKLSSGIINAKNEKGIIIYALDDNFSYITNNDFLLRDDVLYSDLAMNEIPLIIPNIEFTSNGDVISKTYSEKTYEVKSSKNLIKNKIIESFFFTSAGNLPIMFSNQKTFLKILNLMFNNKSSIDLSSKEIYDFIDVEKTFVYIENIYNIDSVVNKLKNSNFSITYAFDSFENFGVDLFKSNILYNVILIIIITLSIIYIVLTYKNYLKSQQKDIGVLKFFGYSENNIYSIYSHTLYKLLIIVFALVSVFNIIICFNNLSVFPLITIVEASILFIITLIIRITLIKKIVKNDILFLLKYSKEFE
ncbi:hypothetical protein BD780_000905 [Clostridium tetanomorphum]|nr:hypothetical protein [Clostridium tetanomorphum]